MEQRLCHLHERAREPLEEIDYGGLKSSPTCSPMPYVPRELLGRKFVTRGSIGSLWNKSVQISSPLSCVTPFLGSVNNRIRRPVAMSWTPEHL